MRIPLLLPPLVCALPAFAQSNLPAKESLTYNIEWRLFNAGRAKVDLSTTGGSRPNVQANLRLESSGIVSKLFKVEDEYASILNSNLCAQSVEMKTNEGNRHRETRIAFDPETKKAS